MALMEAMSCGLPAVCSKIRGNTDLIEHGVDGLFAENTPEGVASAILKLYHDPVLREQLGRAASQTGFPVRRESGTAESEGNLPVPVRRNRWKDTE